MMMKTIICLCLFALISVKATDFKLSEKALQFLASVKLRDLPEAIQRALTRSQGRADGDASHWCCVNEQPITTVTQTKIEYLTRTVDTKTIVGYVNCGVFGADRCPHYVHTYRTVIDTFIQTFQVPNMAACQSHEVKCCSGYLLVADNCHTYQDLAQNMELIQFLHGLGLLSTPSLG